jgi:hypothetical protein
MKTKSWKNPVKGVPAKEETLNIKGDFGAFTDLMKRVVNAPAKTPKASSSSRAPVAS